MSWTLHRSPFVLSASLLVFWVAVVVVTPTIRPFRISGWHIVQGACCLVIAIHCLSMMGNGRSRECFGAAFISGGILLYQFIDIYCQGIYYSLVVAAMAVVTFLGIYPIAISLIGAALRGQDTTLTCPRNCKMCGYCLKGLSENRCPECGQTFDPILLDLECHYMQPAGGPACSNPRGSIPSASNAQTSHPSPKR